MCKCFNIGFSSRLLNQCFFFLSSSLIQKEKLFGVFLFFCLGFGGGFFWALGKVFCFFKQQGKVCFSLYWKWFPMHHWRISTMSCVKGLLLTEVFICSVLYICRPILVKKNTTAAYSKFFKYLHYTMLYFMGIYYKYFIPWLTCFQKQKSISYRHWQYALTLLTFLCVVCKFVENRVEWHRQICNIFCI